MLDRVAGRCDSAIRMRGVPRFRAIRTRRSAAHAEKEVWPATAGVNFQTRDIFLEVCGTSFYPECEDRDCFPNGNGLRPRRGIRAEGTAPLPSLTAHTEAGPWYDAAPPGAREGRLRRISHRHASAARTTTGTVGGRATPRDARGAVSRAIRR